jgi:hypothetical protein
MTPTEGTPWERPDSWVHWKPSREVILIGTGLLARRATESSSYRETRQFMSVSRKGRVASRAQKKHMVKRRYELHTESRQK